MNVVSRRPMSLQDFLEWEEQQEFRYEFDGYQPIEMTGGTVGHSIIATELLCILVGHLRGKSCQAFCFNLKILVDGRIRYPDVFVVCVPLAPKATVVSEPAIIFEVYSESTAPIDLNIKSAEYGATPSVRRYIALAQDHVAATCFSWDTGVWEAHEIKQGCTLSLPEIGLKIPLDDIYAGLKSLTDPANNP